MPRVNSVEKARKSPGTCSKCGKKIEPGTRYIWWKFRFGGKRIRCGSCPRPRQSELTNSDKLSRCYAAGESIQDAIEEFQKDFDVDSLRSAVEDAANEIRDVASEYRESAENVESGMNNRMPICDELEEKADNLESKADEMDSAAGNLEDFDEDAAKEEAETEAEAEKEEKKEEAKEEVKEGEEEGSDAEDKKDKKDEKVEKLFEEKREAWVEEQVGHIEEFTDISPE